MAITIDDVVYRVGIDTTMDRALLIAGTDGTNPQVLSVNSGGGLEVASVAPYLASYGSNNLAVNTYYFPSAAGFDMTLYKHAAVTGVFTTAGATTILTAEVRNATTGTWVDITKAGYDPVNDLTSITTITDATGNFGLDFDDLNKALIRFKLVIDNATNTNELDFRAI